MANIRWAHLFTVAIAAMIAPLIVSGEIWPNNGSKELRARLKANVLEREEIKSILEKLNSTDKHAKIGELPVIQLLSWENFDLFVEDNCYNAVRYFDEVMSCDLNTVLNVCKFVDPKLISSCKQTIEQVHGDEQKLAKLRQKKLAPEQVGEILRSISDKENTKIIETSVETLLNQEPIFNLEDCQPDAINARKSYTTDENKILVSNLQKFDKVLDRLLSFCAQDIKKVFEMSTASITEYDRTKIWHVLDRISRDGDYKNMDRIVDECKLVMKSFANINYIKRHQKTGLPEGLDELLGYNWTRLSDACSHLYMCFVNPKSTPNCKPHSEEPSSEEMAAAHIKVQLWRSEIYI